jgi:hypothetical protein
VNRHGLSSVSVLQAPSLSRVNIACLSPGGTKPAFLPEPTRTARARRKRRSRPAERPPASRVALHGARTGVRHIVYRRRSCDVAPTGVERSERSTKENPCAACCLVSSRPRFVGGRAPRRVSDGCPTSPEPARTIGRLFDYPAEGTRRARDRPAQPADPVPPAEHRSQKARSAGRQFATKAKALSEWRHGVGRQARQSGGELCCPARTFCAPVRA